MKSFLMVVFSSLVFSLRKHGFILQKMEFGVLAKWLPGFSFVFWALRN